MTLLDYGGRLDLHLAEAQALLASGTHVAVKFCASACIVILHLLSPSQLCFYPDAWIGYHSADWNGGAQLAYEMTWERGSDWIARGYRPC